MEEDIKKLLKHKNDYDVWNGSKISRPYTMTDEDFELIENILNELERLQKEFKAVDHECSRLEQKEVELEKENRKYRLEIIPRLDEELQVYKERINALKNEKTVHTCLHCGNDTPLYCEKCQQELITKNAELQMRYEKIDKFLHSNSCVFQNENGDIQGILLTPENFIPKQVIRDRLKELNKQYRDYIEKWEKSGMNKQHPFYRYIVRLEAQIDILKELLGE